MKKPQVYMVFDYETFSEAEMYDVGAFEYSAHPSTEILCIAYRIGTREQLKNGETKLVIPSEGGSNFGEFYSALLNPDIKLVAHNAFFEQVITKNVYAKRLMYRTPELLDIPLTRWVCTAVMAATVGLPRDLAGACLELNLINKKDTEGKKIMLKLSKPRKPTKHDSSTRHSDFDDYEKLYDYCIKDTNAEVELFLKLPMLTKKERQFWLVDLAMNWRGFGVDRKLVEGALYCVEKQKAITDSRVFEVTNGRVNSARQHKAYLAELKASGLDIDNMQKETIELMLHDKNLKPLQKELLKLRLASSKSSTAKYAAFEAGSRFDGRARDNILSFGAHTGRHSGQGIQPQNLFKRTIDQKDVEVGIELVKAKDFDAINAMYDEPTELYASLLRSCIVAPKGKTLDVGDFSTIEARVLFWLSGHERGLEAFSRGEDLYIDMASAIYGEDVSLILKGYKSGSIEGVRKRQLGKEAFLGSGFGMGLNGIRFQQSAKSKGIDITIELAQKSILAYRQKHHPVPKFWKDIENDAIAAVQNPTKAYKRRHLTWAMQGDWLTVTLPIGRKLYYYKPKLSKTENLYGTDFKLSYMGVNPVTKQFERMGTWGGPLAENVTQAVARDLLMEALLKLEQEKISLPVLPVHDEIVSERDILNKEGHKRFLEVMAMVPDWAKGLPIKVEGWHETRYRK